MERINEMISRIESTFERDDLHSISSAKLAELVVYLYDGLLDLREVSREEKDTAGGRVVCA